MKFSIRDFFYVLAFLSRIPVPENSFDNRQEKGLADYVVLFPLAGLAIALAPAFVGAVLMAINLDPMVIAILLVGLEVILIGALHEDGLADCADGFYGGHDRTKRLAIMKDSTIGTYGAMALILSVALRIACLIELINTLPAWAFFLTLLALGALSRAAMAIFWSLLTPAKTNGLAHSSGMPEEDQARIALGIGIAFYLPLILMGVGILAALLSLALAGLVLWGFSALTQAKIGGFTGDTLGASQQLTQMALLIGLVAAL